MLEYMTVNRPVVTNPVGEVKNILGEEGFFASNTPDQMAQLVLRCLEREDFSYTPERRLQHSWKARGQVYSAMLAEILAPVSGVTMRAASANNVGDNHEQTPTSRRICEAIMASRISIARLYSRLIRGFARASFDFWQCLGVHLTPNHFYQPIPNTRKLKPALWGKASCLVGLRMNEDQQLRLLDEFVKRFKAEYECFPITRPATPNRYFVRNGGFEAVDGEVLYCMVRLLRPRRVIEVGSGNSTLLLVEALQKNLAADGRDFELTVIDPFPSDTINAGVPGVTRVIAREVQGLDTAFFQQLDADDILFIDSSHVVGVGSDVNYELLEIVPRLRKGVVIHFHDIFLPAEYLKEWIFQKRWFWSEQYLLQAFLAFNESYDVVWASSYMHLRHPGMLERAFTAYRRQVDWPGSFWIRRVR